MLALGIRYLNGYVSATEPDDEKRAEWPPHPGRVFMALAAAHFQTGGDPQERKALQWLEGLEAHGEPAAPHIVAPSAIQRSIVTQYVPVNDNSAGFKKKSRNRIVFQEIGQTGLRRNRQGRTFTKAWLVENDTVYFYWPGFEPDPSIRAALEGLCEKVTRIGHSMSLVHVWLAETGEFGGATWVPDHVRAEIQLRLAPAGTLEYLERQFNGKAVDEYTDLQLLAIDNTDKNSHSAARKRLREEYSDGPPTRRRPSLSVYQGYAPPLPKESERTAIGTLFSPHMIGLRLIPIAGQFRQLDLTCTLSVVGRWREALLSQSNGLSDAGRSVLSGHKADGIPLEDPHLALVPLPFVGHGHADGHLLGVGAFLPKDISFDCRRDVLRALARVRKLKLGRLGVWKLETVTEAHPSWSLSARAWTAQPKGALEWATVTPIAFDRHPKVKGKAAYRAAVVEMIKQCAARIGLPRPRHVVVTSVSVHSGVPPNHAFPGLHRKDGSSRRHTHAILLFDNPVRGPILLGAGRYRGYGYCRPLGCPVEGGSEP